MRLFANKRITKRGVRKFLTEAKKDRERTRRDMRKRQASIAVKIKILPVSAGGRAPIEVSVLPHSGVSVG